MVAEYNTRAKAQGFPPEKMSAIQGNLLVPEDASGDINPVLKGAEWFDFDVAIVNAGYHHFEDPELAAKRLVERLKPGSGIIVVVDFLEHGGWRMHQGAHSSQAHNHGHHHGNPDVKDGEASHGDPEKDVLATIAHYGFSVERISACFQSAGCVDVGVQVFEEPVKFGEGAKQMDVKVFMAKGTREGN